MSELSISQHVLDNIPKPIGTEAVVILDINLESIDLAIVHNRKSTTLIRASVRQVVSKSAIIAHAIEAIVPVDIEMGVINKIRHLSVLAVLEVFARELPTSRRAECDCLGGKVQVLESPAFHGFGADWLLVEVIDEAVSVTQNLLRDIFVAIYIVESKCDSLRRIVSSQVIG